MMDSARERREDGGEREDLGSNGNFRSKSRYTFPDSRVSNQVRLHVLATRCPSSSPPLCISLINGLRLRCVNVHIVGDTAWTACVGGAILTKSSSFSFFKISAVSQATLRRRTRTARTNLFKVAR